MSAAAPELPRRTPGAALLAGDEFEHRPPVVENGPPACFECGRRPATFTLTMTTPTLSGGRVTVSRHLCSHDTACVAADLPRDVEVIITRFKENI